MNRIARRSAAMPFIACLASLALASPTLAETPPAAAHAPQITHTPVTCFIARQPAQLTADVTPGGQLAYAHAYFKSRLGKEFYYVVFSPVGAHAPASLATALPAPKPGVGPITYYVEAASKTGGIGRTQEIQGIIVDRREECRDRVAALLPPSGAGAAVFAAGGVPATAPGFGLAAGGAGSFLTSTAGFVTAGAVAAGAAVIIVTSGGQETRSPSR
jgi:hypothetical protein